MTHLAWCLVKSDGRLDLRTVAPSREQARRYLRVMRGYYPVVGIVRVRVTQVSVPLRSGRRNEWRSGV